MGKLLTEIKEHLRAHRAPYIVAGILSLTSFLFLQLWNGWLYQALAQRAEAIPRRVLGAAIGLLSLWLLLSIVLVLFYARKYRARDHTSLLQDLRNKVRVAHDDNMALRRENDICYEKLKEANAQSERLNNQIKELTHHDLDETELKLLNTVAQVDYDHCVIRVIQANFFSEFTVQRVRYHLSQLEELKLVRSGFIDSLGAHYAITQKGRELLFNKDLL